MIVCAGEALIDMVPYASAEGQAFLPRVGGSPCNTAVAAARLSAPAGFLGSVSADFFGRQIRARLAENGVSEDFVLECGAPTTLAVVGGVPGSAPEYMFYIDGTSAAMLDGDKLDALFGKLALADCVVFGSISLLLEPSGSALSTLCSRLAALPDGPLVALDPNVRQAMVRDRTSYLTRLEALIARADIVKLSDEDCAYLYPDAAFEAALGRILDMGPRLVAGTGGPRGSVGLKRNADGTMTRVAAAALAVKVADTVGAGDTFPGALLAWMARNKLLEREKLAELSESELAACLAFASCASGLVCTRRGSEPPFLSELTPYLYR